MYKSTTCLGCMPGKHFSFFFSRLWHLGLETFPFVSCSQMLFRTNLASKVLYLYGAIKIFMLCPTHCFFSLSIPGSLSHFPHFPLIQPKPPPHSPTETLKCWIQKPPSILNFQQVSFLNLPFSSGYRHQPNIKWELFQSKKLCCWRLRQLWEVFRFQPHKLSQKI